MQVVTGGAGFIGSNILKALEDRRHHDTVVCDVLGTESKWRNIAKRELSFILQPQELFSFLAQNVSHIETIFHMGAISTTTERDADAIVTNNVRLSQALWSWCASHKKRFIYASSAATYGNGGASFLDDDSPEFLATLQPLNAYGWSKHLFDRWVARQVHSGVDRPTQSVGLKFFNVYGPNEYHKSSQRSVVSQAFDTIQQGKTVTLFKSTSSLYLDGGQLRDFIYVKDCVKAVLWFLDHPHLNGLYNVGTGKARSFKDLVVAVYSAMDKNPQIHYVEMPESLKATYQNYTQAQVEKLSGTGFSPSFSLEEGVKDYVEHFLMKEDPFL